MTYDGSRQKIIILSRTRNNDVHAPPVLWPQSDVKLIRIDTFGRSDEDKEFRVPTTNFPFVDSYSIEGNKKKLKNKNNYLCERRRVLCFTDSKPERKEKRELNCRTRSTRILFWH